MVKRKFKHKQKRISDCHPDVPHLAKGFCKNCYANYLRDPSCRIIKHRLTRNRMAGCHPDRQHFAKGFCRTCYEKHLKYGIDYSAAYANVQGKCEICKKHFDILDIDHDHRTGKVRGLVCNACNMLIGKVENRFDLLLEIYKYLARTSVGRKANFYKKLVKKYDEM